MIRVTFPTGVSVEYPEANFMERSNSEWKLWTEKDGNAVAGVAVAGGVVVDWHHALNPPNITNRAAIPTDKAALDRVLLRLRDMPAEKLRELKAALRDFNAKSWTWG